MFAISEPLVYPACSSHEVTVMRILTLRDGDNDEVCSGSQEMMIHAERGDFCDEHLGNTR